MYSKNSINKAIVEKSKLSNYLSPSPRMVPKGLEPQCHRMSMVVGKYLNSKSAATGITDTCKKTVAAERSKKRKSKSGAQIGPVKKRIKLDAAVGEKSSKTIGNKGSFFGKVPFFPALLVSKEKDVQEHILGCSETEDLHDSEHASSRHVPHSLPSDIVMISSDGEEDNTYLSSGKEKYPAVLEIDCHWPKWLHDSEEEEDKIKTCIKTKRPPPPPILSFGTILGENERPFNLLQKWKERLGGSGKEKEDTIDDNDVDEAAKKSECLKRALNHNDCDLWNDQEEFNFDLSEMDVWLVSKKSEVADGVGLTPVFQSQIPTFKQCGRERLNSGIHQTSTPNTRGEKTKKKFFTIDAGGQCATSPIEKTIKQAKFLKVKREQESLSSSTSSIDAVNVESGWDKDDLEAMMKDTSCFDMVENTATNTGPKSKCTDVAEKKGMGESVDEQLVVGVNSQSSLCHKTVKIETERKIIVAEDEENFMAAPSASNIKNDISVDFLFEDSGFDKKLEDLDLSKSAPLNVNTSLYSATQLAEMVAANSPRTEKENVKRRLLNNEDERSSNVLFKLLSDSNSDERKATENTKHTSNPNISSRNGSLDDIFGNSQEDEWFANIEEDEIVHTSTTNIRLAESVEKNEFKLPDICEFQLMSDAMAQKNEPLKSVLKKFERKSSQETGVEGTTFSSPVTSTSMVTSSQIRPKESQSPIVKRPPARKRIILSSDDEDSPCKTNLTCHRNDTVANKGKKTCSISSLLSLSSHGSKFVKRGSNLGGKSIRTEGPEGCSHESYAPKKNQKRKERAGSFFDKEAVLSEEDSDEGDDEEGSDLDAYEESFMDDQSQQVSIDQTAMYIRSVKSPILKNLQKQQRLRPITADIYSQAVLQDDPDDTYGEDSFCVGNDEIEYDTRQDTLDMCKGVKMKKTVSTDPKSRSGDDNNSVPPKRRRIMERPAMSSSEDDASISENLPKSLPATPVVGYTTKEMRLIKQRELKALFQQKMRDRGKSSSSSSSTVASISITNPTHIIRPDLNTSMEEVSKYSILVNTADIHKIPDLISQLKHTYHLAVHIRSFTGAGFLVSPRLAIERWMSSDFYNGANRRKLLEQCQLMNDLFERPCLIIESDKAKDEQGHVPARSLHALRSRTKYVDMLMCQLAQTKIQVVFTDNQEQSARIVNAQLQRERSRGFALPRPLKLTFRQEKALPFYKSFPGVGLGTALQLVSNFNSSKQLADCALVTLMRKTGLDQPRARKILVYVKTLFEGDMKNDGK